MNINLGDHFQRVDLCVFRMQTELFVSANSQAIYLRIPKGLNVEHTIRSGKRVKVTRLR